MEILEKRCICEYTNLEKDDMEDDKEIVIRQLKKLERSGISKIFDNQEIISHNIIAGFKNKKIINIMLIAKTQSGKTGSMCATIKRFMEDTTNYIPIKNIYIITGLSSCEWIKQTKERLPIAIQEQIFHRNKLVKGNKQVKSFVEEIKNKKNILIIMDEIQIAAKKNQTIYKSFKNANLLNKDNLYKNDIKILEYTATPDGTIYDLMKWGDSSKKILADSGEKYISSYDLFKLKRVKQYKDLCGYNKKTQLINKEVFENIKELKIDIDNYKIPKYHIIRIHSNKDNKNLITIENFKKIFDDSIYNFILYDISNDNKDINLILEEEPVKHTLIFIKEMLRCAKTICKKYKGISYERHSKKIDDTSIIQGLVGRDTGYDVNKDSICYTNIESIEKYEILWNSKFEDNSINWNSKTTKYINGITCGQDTFNDPKNYEGFSSSSSDDDDENNEVYIEKFQTLEELRNFYDKNLKNIFGGSGPQQKRPINSNGFYETSILDTRKIYSCKYLDTVRDWGFSSKYRVHPCYEDVNDKTTLRWWIVYRL